MSTIDIIVLGAVAGQPKSAYDIQKYVDEHNLSEWTRISIPSIYKKVLRLQEQGYITSIEPAGERAAGKTIYRITEIGREYLRTLMLESSLATPKVIMDFNAVICNLNKIGSEDALQLIQNITSGISRAKEYYHSELQNHSDIPLTGKAIMEQQELICSALLEWSQELYEKFKEEYHDEKL